MTSISTCRGHDAGGLGLCLLNDQGDQLGSGKGHLDPCSVGDNGGVGGLSHVGDQGDVGQVNLGGGIDSVGSVDGHTGSRSNSSQQFGYCDVGCQGAGEQACKDQENW